MHIAHLGLWSRDLERSKHFYCHYFGASAGANYHNPAKGFRSCFLDFGHGSQLELMHSTALELPTQPPGQQQIGLTHLAISTGSAKAVDTLTERLRSDGYTIASEPRRTGDGYYESVILDPDGCRIEITD
ncbi:VOC family protein [Chitinibacter sp. FCG-7]|uniref:VOC family protein n=1 Tax=Chitinibacter mangrovi TaxID=3153927 RepID=A0AAU7FDA3_9NEIS